MVNYISGLVVCGPAADRRRHHRTVRGELTPSSQRSSGRPGSSPTRSSPRRSKLAAQWQRAVVFRLGKFKEIKGPGLFLIIPLIDQIRMVDTRVLAVNIPKQQVITRDNVPVVIDGVLFFRVINAADAIIMVQDYRLHDRPVRADLAPRRHRPDDPGPALRVRPKTLLSIARPPETDDRAGQIDEGQIVAGINFKANLETTE